MLSITINNNFLRIAAPARDFFEKIPLDPSLVDDCRITNQEGFVALVEKALTDVELPSKEVIVGLNEEKTYLLESASVDGLSGLAPYEVDQLYVTVKERGFRRKGLSSDGGELSPESQLAAVEKNLVDGYSQVLEVLGFRVQGFVPLALSLANLTKEKETPHLIVCLEDDELVFVLVKEGGTVPFSATYPADHILESTTAVLEFAKEKYQTTNIKKIYICGEKSDQIAKALKEAKLLVEELKIDPPEFCKAVSLLKFDDPDLTIRPGSLAPKRSKLTRLPTLNLPPLTIPLTLAALLITGVVFGGLVFFRNKTKTPTSVEVTEVPEAPPEATTAAEPSEEFDKSAYEIQVLNAKGVQGVAASTRDKLEGLGYQVVDIDNTSWRLDSVIKTKEGNGALLESLTQDLEGEYNLSESEILEKTSEFDAVVVIGSQ